MDRFPQGFPMASPGMDFRNSLIPIFVSRLKTLRAMAPGLRDLPAPAFNELQSLLERAEAVIRELSVLSPLSRPAASVYCSHLSISQNPVQHGPPAVRTSELYAAGAGVKARKPQLVVG